MTTTKVRKQVPLDPDDLADLSALRAHEEDKVTALHDLTGIRLKDNASEAETLHALLVAGRKALAEKELALGFERAAEYERDHPEVQAWRAAMRGRHLRSFDVSAGAA